MAVLDSRENVQMGMREMRDPSVASHRGFQPPRPCATPLTPNCACAPAELKSNCPHIRSPDETIQREFDDFIVDSPTHPAFVLTCMCAITLDDGADRE
ncbi:Hypothetical protein NTJ_03930 [Nesidiocoris tenuis]|uniref:Uncharacterized protein n=1 Tax=Nesidiocoris tenuis TaxID=355587 RepID=A0ABN7AFR3_9HEMI|nr:Hypothetical protein NTJ_03930 [Nesidiocoris tenuis]